MCVVKEEGEDMKVWEAATTYETKLEEIQQSPSGAMSVTQ